MEVEVIQIHTEPDATIFENYTAIRDIKADIEKSKQESLDMSLSLILLEQRIEKLEQKETPIAPG